MPSKKARSPLSPQVAFYQVIADETRRGRALSDNCWPEGSHCPLKSRSGGRNRHGINFGLIETKPEGTDGFVIRDQEWNPREIAAAMINNGEALDRLQKAEVHLRRAYNRTQRTARCVVRFATSSVSNACKKSA